MKFIVNKEDTIRILENVFVIPTKSSSLSSNVLLEAKNDTLVVTTSDLETNIKSYTKAEIYEEGGVILPIRNLLEIFRRLPQEKITIETTEDGITSIQTENSKFKLLGLNKEEFPIFPSINTQDKLYLEAPVLEEVLRKTSFAMAYDDLRYILNGMLFKIEKNKITTAATDGHRLAAFYKTLKQPHQVGNIQIVIQNKTVNELLKILKDKNDVYISIDRNQAIFQIDDITLVTRLLEGEYPDYENLLQKKANKILKIKTNNLYDSITRAELMTTEKNNMVKFNLTTSEFKITASSPNLGEVEELVDMEEYKGDPLEIRLNPQFIKDVLRNVSSVYINLYFSTHEESVVLKPEEEDFVGVIMPVKILS